MDREEFVQLWADAEKQANEQRFEKALMVFHQIQSYTELPASPLEKAYLYSNIGICHLNLAEREKALQSFDVALPLFEKHGRPADIALCHLNRANCLGGLRRDNEALQGYDEALSVYGQHGSPTDIALCHSNRANCLSRLGHYPEALQGYAQALPLFEEHGLHTDVALCLMNKANCLGLIGRHKEALRLHDIALQKYELHGVPINIAHSQLNRANCLGKLGLHEHALQGYEIALAHFEQHGLPSDIATCQMNRANCLGVLGHLEEALTGYELALPTYEQIGPAINIARCRMNRAGCLAALGLYEEALHEYDDALHTYKKQGLPTEIARCHMNRSICLGSLHRHDEALEGYTIALSLFEQHGLPSDTALCQENRANCLLALRHYEEALSVYDTTLVLYKSLGLRINIGRCQMNRASCLVVMGKFEEAQWDYESAFQSLEKVGVHADDTRLRIQYGLARLTQLLSDLDLASYHIAISCDLADTLASRLQDSSHRTSFREQWTFVFQLGLQIALAQGDIPAAFDFGQRSKGRIITDLLRAHGIVSELDLRERELTNRHEAGSFDQDEYNSSLALLRQERLEALNALKGVDPQKPLSLPEIANALQQGEILMDVIQHNDNVLSCFLILPKTTTVAHHFEIDVARLNKVLSRWHKERNRFASMYIARINKAGSSDDGGPNHNDANVNNLIKHHVPITEAIMVELGEVIFGPVLPLLRQHSISSIIISPDGPLHQVPLAAVRLTEDEETAYVIDEFDLQLIPTASSLAILRNSARSHWPPTVLGAAPFSKPRVEGEEPESDDGEIDPPNRSRGLRGIRSQEDDTFPELAATGPEIQEVARLLEALTPAATPRLIFNPTATRAEVESGLHAARIVHISTHGSRPKDGDTTMGYSINFSNKTKISIDEVYQKQLSLLDVIFICLSACDLGEVVQKGGEAMGFNQAFLQAGAANVIAPIWAVEDYATAHLMTIWYTHLTSDERPSLRKSWAITTRTIREDPVYRHPYFWAAFLPNGDAALRLMPAAY